MAERMSREVAVRVFARELNEAQYTFKESDDDRAPSYVLLPTGERANRVFFIGTLTETNDIGDGEPYWQGRVVDPTGTFFVYAGQYQPDAAEVLGQAEPPEYVAVTGKPNTYETDDGDIRVSIRPETITPVTGEERDRWVVETAKHTADRVNTFDPDGQYGAMVVEEYGEDVPDQYMTIAKEALQSLKGDDHEPADDIDDDTADADANNDDTDGVEEEEEAAEASDFM